MKKTLTTLLPVLLAAAFAFAFVGAAVVQAGPEEDREAFVNYFSKRFPNTPSEAFVDGTYAIDAALREQWQVIEEFPPYELALERGQALFETPFANGKTFADCFPNGGIGIRQNYPYFDTERGEVITLELAINECREANGEKPFKYKKGDIVTQSIEFIR